MGHNEDNLWSLLKDLMPLWILLAFMVMIFYIHAKTPSPPRPRWMQSRYFRWLEVALLLFMIGRLIYQVGRMWRLF